MNLKTIFNSNTRYKNAFDNHIVKINLNEI